MPLSVNVGLSRKRSKDYQSEGVSINLTAELDQSLLARPEELQQQIDGLYQQAEAALDRQVSVTQPQSQSRQQQPQQHRSQPSRNGGYNRNAVGNGNGRGNNYPQQQQPPQSNGSGNGSGRPNAGTMTESQKRAINAIARRLNLDAVYECQQVFGWELDKLSIKQASELIDHLKAQTSDDTRR
jgi:hypothetical protein